MGQRALATMALLPLACFLVMARRRLSHDTGQNGAGKKRQQGKNGRESTEFFHRD